MKTQNTRRRYKSISDGDFQVFSLITRSIGDAIATNRSQLIEVIVDYLQENDQDSTNLTGKDRETGKCNKA